MNRNNMERVKYHFMHIALLIQIGLLVFDVIVVPYLHLERLSAKEVMNISFDFSFMLLSIIIYGSCLYGRKSRSTNIFLSFIFVVFLCLFFESGAWMIDRIPSLRIMNYVCNIFCNSMMLVTALYYHLFACKALEISDFSTSKIKKSVFTVSFLGIAAEILNIWGGYFYKVDVNGVYVRAEVGSILGYIPFAYILGITAVIIVRQEISKRLQISYLLYIFVPVAVSIWYILTDYPPTFVVSSFISVTLIYSNIYLALGREADQYVIRNYRQELELQELNNQIILSQIKPHFLYNVLGSIEELCRIDAREAEKAVYHFSKYLRANMDTIGGKELITFGKELEHIRNYMWLEAMRFGDDLIYEEDVEAESFLIPPLCIQPVVENAVKHGLMGKADGTVTVKLTCTESENEYIIRVTDDGCGFDVNAKPAQDNRSHVGNRAVRETVENKCHGSFEIVSTIGSGTKVTIKIPKSSV